MAEKNLWNDGWEFTERALEDMEKQLPHIREIPAEQWRTVELPHDWLISDTTALYRNSIGWYRKRYVIQKAENMEYLLRFDGVYMDSTVYCNGEKVMEWKYGYSMFEADLTPFIRDGENEVYVRMVYQAPNSRWYSGAGIYRDVWLKERQATHLVSDGIYITPERNADESWKVKNCTEIKTAPQNRNGVCKIVQKLFDPKGKMISAGGRLVPMEEIDEDGRVSVQLEMQAGKVQLWKVGEGILYTLRTELYCGKELMETEECRFGFRTLEYTQDEGLFINGEHVKLHGVCEHHDLGCLGAAFSKDAMRRKMDKLRAMGVNAIRTAHNMPAEGFLELADEMGFLIDDEGFDMWKNPKTEYDYARFFDAWAERDIESWIRRDRNHPSVIMWSIGNEITDTVWTEEGRETAVRMRDAIRRWDPLHHAPVTLGSNFLQYDFAQNCTEELELAGYNYLEYLYPEHHKQKHWKIYGSETSSILSSRNIYHFPKHAHIISEADEQCSSLGNTITGWCGESTAAVICDDENTPYSIGHFLWSGFDYIGESTPYETKNSYFGQLDLAGFPKDAYYLYQAAWTDHTRAPMVHIFPYWDFNPGQVIDITAASNAPWVELFLNGKSLGKKAGFAHAFDHKAQGEELPVRWEFAEWSVLYERGELRAVAYDDEQNVIAETVRKTFGDAEALVLCNPKAYRYGKLVFLEIAATDREGNIVENANNIVGAEADGDVRILALDNGDSADPAQHQGTWRRLFGGRMLVVAELKKDAEGVIKLFSPGIRPACIHLKKEECSVTTEAAMKTDMDEIPIRKIELCLRGEQRLTTTKAETEVSAILYPENAACAELRWEFVNAVGIPVDLVSIEKKTERRIVLHAKHDGSGYLRCMANNGQRNVQVISQMEIYTEGFGEKRYDPFQWQYAGLRTAKEGRVEEGVQHGMNFLGTGRGGATGRIRFENFDFGKTGAAALEVSFFANTKEAVSFRLRITAKETGEVLIRETFRYQKTPEWMCFKPCIYDLPERVCGLCSLEFETEDAFQFREFRFLQNRSNGGE